MNKSQQQQHKQGRQIREKERPTVRFRSFLRSLPIEPIHPSLSRAHTQRAQRGVSPQIDPSPVETTTPRHHHRWSVRSWLPRFLILRGIRNWLAAPRHYIFVGASLIVGLGLVGYVVVNQQLMAMRYHLLPSVAHAVGPADTALLAKVHYDPKQGVFALSASKTPAITGNSVSVGGSPADPGYNFQLPTHLSKGISVTDPVSKLSMLLIPTSDALTGHRVDNHFVYPLATAGAQDIYTVKANGLQEDIALPGGLTHSLSFSYTLKLPSDLQARRSANGTIGIYTASSALFGNISYGSSADQVLVNTARQNGQKTNLVFALPAPVVEEASRPGFPSPSTNSVRASYLLKGDQLTLVLHVSQAVTGPIVIDPSIVVASASGFNTGNNEGDISINNTNNSISTSGLTGGSISAGWTSTNSFANARGGMGTVAYNGYLYIVGGAGNSVYYNDVQYAPINSNGTIGTWTATTSFTTARWGLIAVAYNGYLYIMGGQYSSSYLNDVQYAPINANGTLGTWAATTSFTTGRSEDGGVAYNGYLYIMGGQGSGGDLNDVQYASINANGTIGMWTATTSLPFTVLQGFDAVAYNGYLYIVGGADPGLLTTVDYAPINANGTIGAWTATTSFTTSRQNFGAVVYDGYLYIMGGQGYLNDVQYAPINANGSIGSWTATASFIDGNNGLGAVAYNGYLYIMGGSDSSSALNTVQYAPIDPAGVVSGWTGTTALPTGTQQATSVAYNGYVYEIGGYANFSGSQSFGYTGGTQSFTVPAGVTSITVTLYGAQGGAGNAGTFAGGYEGVVTGTLAVTPGEVLTLIVAGQGASSFSGDPSGGEIGGYGGGGNAGYLAGCSCSSVTSGAGGGASQILSGSTELAVAAGGGGGGPDSINGQAPIGGAGGGNVGAKGFGYGSSGGNGGTQTAGGTGANAGASLQGGLGLSGYPYPGGGGGGGYFGGGGGNQNGGGGGGSSLVPAGGTTTAGVMGGNGSVTISYSGTAPTTSVDYAPINANGTLGTWTATTSLPTATDWATSVVYNGYLYEIGGANSGTTGINTVDYAPINSNGTLGSWTATTSLPAATLYATSVAYNGYLYEIGGSNGGWFATVDYAPINSNGTLGSWTATTSLPAATPQATSVVYNGYLYEIGGCNTSCPATTVDYAPINSNGTLGSWTATTSLPTATQVATSVAFNGYLYEIGGYNGSAAVATVDYAPINSNGTLGSWTATTSLPTGIKVATSVVYNGYVYEIGGYNGSLLATVDYAQINNGGPGTTSAWTATTSLPTATVWSTSVAYNGYLYEIGGYTTTPIATVEYAPINANGTLGAWTATTSLPTATQSATSVVYNGYVYEIGGYNGPISAVDYALINSNGTLGAWTATTSLPTATHCATSVVYNGYLYEIGGYSGSSTLIATVDYAPINANGTLGSWTATTSLPLATTIATTIAYNGYLYEIAGEIPGNWSNTVDYAPINADGTIGAWTATSSLIIGTYYATSVAYNGYVYEIGGNSGSSVAAVEVAGLQSIPRIGEYSRLLDLTGSSTNDPTPIELLTNGTNIGNPGIGSYGGLGTGGISVDYSFASNACSTLLTPNTFSTGISDQLGTPFKLNFTINGCGTATNIGRYVWVRYTIDDSQTATFPDINGNHTTISAFTVYYHPASGNRLRGGATFSNGSLQTLDAPP